tara:strand:- start:962 stop:1270 length:309 start_codon:yes stop_codon:yes gene_type:complete
MKKANTKHLDILFGFPPVDIFVDMEPVHTNWNVSSWNAGKNLDEEHKNNIGQGVCKSVVVDGVEYPSTNAAAKALGVVRQYIWVLQKKGRAYKGTLNTNVGL